MRNVVQTALLIGVFAASLFSQQRPERFAFPHPFPPDIIPPHVFADRDPVRTDPNHFKLDFPNDRVRVLRLTMKGSEGTPIHDEPDILALCLKDCDLRLTRPDGKIQDLHMKAGEVRWVWEDTRSEKNLGKELLEMLLVEMKGKHATSN